MRYLGLDLGTKTIGLAISDKTGLIATSYKVLHHDNNPESCLDELKSIIKDLEVESLVLGLPKNMNNTLGSRAEATLKFKEFLESNIDIPIYLEDERLTTKSAEALLIKGDTSRKKRKKVIDKVAATIILQSFLDRRK
ncbi:MAG TPA: Holliday junction resolvase RuvX [Candidatus Onthousia faecipullorum]|uniref:Putative pre-16S rRNA nuclease n=1 Tax=Candidatus Onthousia faecipullorum TaxID=2840887 RepID=A0A9D1GC34_9FIRM|nr:Holliday junction resolvase RuvX [Candidatus Onthousia faecipullorum]